MPDSYRMTGSGGTPCKGVASVLGDSATPFARGSGTCHPIAALRLSGRTRQRPLHPRVQPAIVAIRRAEFFQAFDHLFACLVDGVAAQARQPATSAPDRPCNENNSNA